MSRKWKDHIVRVNSISPRVAELVLCIAKRYKLRIVQVYAPTTSYSNEDINNFYNDVDDTLGKPNHDSDGRLQCSNRDIRKYNQEITREIIMASKSLKKVQRTQMLGQDRLITLLDKQGNIIERIEEFYTEPYDSEQSSLIYTDPKEVLEITSWEVEAALRNMKNGTATGNDHINIETLKAGEDTISKTLAKLYTKCTYRWKNAKMTIIFKNRNKKDLKNYRPICLLSNIYKVLTKVLTKRLEKTLDENQP